MRKAKVFCRTCKHYHTMWSIETCAMTKTEKEDTYYDSVIRRESPRVKNVFNNCKDYQEET